MRYPAKLSGATREFYRELWALVDQLAEESSDMTYAELARASGVNPQTIKRLFAHETRFPWFQTVYRVAKALGFRVTLTKAPPVQVRRTA